MPMTEDNLIQTFQLEQSNLRGRILRLGSVIDDLLRRHDYPAQVLQLTGEAAAMALMLSSMLKYEGIFTLQIQGDGPVDMVVADVVNHGNIRACARYKKDAEIPELSNPMLLLGKGYLAFTVDQGPDTEKYQGIVALSGKTLQDSIQHYFAQSEQITTGLRYLLSRGPDGRWRAGGIMLQRLPEQSGAGRGEAHEDDWRRAMVLLQSCTDAELLDPDLSQNDLLFRLFHEEGIRVFDPVPVRDQCRCSAERAENILRMISSAERAEMTIEGKLVVTCEFCNRAYGFDAEAVEREITGSGPQKPQE